MGEAQVSVDGVLRKLDELFFVIATQNPIEFHGTYPLPEAQMDRFAMRFDLGYVDSFHEVAILSEQNKVHPLEKISPCVSKQDVISTRQAISDIRIGEELKDYIVRLSRATREHPDVLNGASPRASLSLMKAAQALALFDGQDFVSPRQIQEIAVPVLAHRLILNSQSVFTGTAAEDIVNEVLKQVAVPT